MNIITIEPTPSPNSMKILVDERLPDGERYNYRKDDSAPSPYKELLALHGVRGIYRIEDFMAVERIANVPWEAILKEIRGVLEGGEQSSTEAEVVEDEHFGEVYVHVQTYKDIPIQVKVFDTMEEKRFALGERFIKAMESVHSTEAENYILLRKWADYGIRYGEKDEIGEAIIAEIEAAYPEERLEAIIEADRRGEEEQQRQTERVTLEQFSNEAWEVRFQLLDQIGEPDVEDLPVLNAALDDEKMSIRRLATAYLGMIEDERVVPLVEKALHDKSWAVRRTAGDCMSDLGFQAFEEAAIRALGDKNKLVRWRAAMYLYETGTERALPALRAVEEDPEFEVKLQIKLAIQRIEGGEEARGSIWKQMTEQFDD